MNIRTWVGNGGPKQWAEQRALEKRAKAPAKASKYQSWGLEVNGDPAFCVDTTDQGVCITQFDIDDDGNSEIAMHVSKDHLAWLIDRLLEAHKRYPHEEQTNG